MGTTVDYQTYFKSNYDSSSSGDNSLAKAVNKSLGKDDFLKLLTTELRNQDPLSPMDNKDFIAQMAQFSTLEQINNMAKSMETLNSSMTMIFQYSLLSQGAALIGKQVSGMDSIGESLIEGVVEAVKWLDGNPQLQLRLADGTMKDMEMNEIISVSEVKKAEELQSEPGTNTEVNQATDGGTDSGSPSELTVSDTGSAENKVQV